MLTMSISGLALACGLLAKQNRVRFGLEGYLTPLETTRLGSVVEGSAHFNPFAPQGHYNLDMTMPGDRDVLRALLLLDKVRPTYVNLVVIHTILTSRSFLSTLWFHLR